MDQELPEWARKIFERRLNAVIGFYAALERAQLLKGKSFRRTEFIKKYAPTQGTSDKNLRRWINAYKKDGEEGLLSGYGKTRGRTIIDSRFSHLFTPLIVPGKTPKAIIEEFKKSCEMNGITPPCKETIQKYIKKSHKSNHLAAPQAHRCENDPILVTAEYAEQSGIYLQTGIPEFDRVLGRGFFLPSSIFLAGDPGVGKSTLMAQVAISLSESQGPDKCIYFSTEQTIDQMAKRLREINPNPRIQVVDEQDLVKIIEIVKRNKPWLCIIDSIKRIRHGSFKGSTDSPHYVSQISKMLRDLSKETSAAIVMINHINKAGEMSGLKSMEHDSDVVLFMKGNPLSGHRMLYSLKNRMGDTTEVGFFRMTDRGLTAFNASELLFKRDHWTRSIGVALLSIRKGSRVFMVEIQSLLTRVVAPKRPGISVTGLEKEQIVKVINTIKERLKIDASNYDITMTTTGEIEVDYPYVQLAIAASILSHAYRKDLSKMVFIGEMDLTGYVRPFYGQDKLIKVALQSEEVRAVFAPQPDNDIKEGVADERIKYIRSIYDLNKILFPGATPYFSFRNDDRQSPYRVEEGKDEVIL